MQRVLAALAFATVVLAMPAASAQRVMAKLARTKAANVVGSHLPNEIFMLALLYFAFTGTISILEAPLGGANLKTVSLKVGFRFQSIM